MGIQKFLRKSVFFCLKRNHIGVIGLFILSSLVWSDRVSGKESQRERDYLQLNEQIRIILQADKENRPPSLERKTIDHVFKEYRKIRRMTSMFKTTFSEIRFLQAFAIEAGVEEEYLFDLLDAYQLDIQKGDRSFLLKSGWNDRKLRREGMLLSSRFLSFLKTIGEMSKKQEFIRILVKESGYYQLGEKDYPKIKTLFMSSDGVHHIFTMTSDVLKKSRSEETFTDENLTRFKQLNKKWLRGQ